ncbi:MAG: hypothetical protein IJQ85_02470 [Selenomonadaceae bacterium]|nr:hypothetical protein [Selenomonadaceae bacterium]
MKTPSKIVDGKNDVYGPLYYVVNLKEKIRHFFMPGWFDDMNAPVRAVVLLRPHYKGLIEPMQQLERTKVIDNWEYTKKYLIKTGEQISGGKWNHYQAGAGYGSGDNKGIKYTSGNVYRTESVIVKATKKNNRDDDSSSGWNTDANGGTFYTEDIVDSINIDFRAEVSKTFTTDWDLGQPLSAQQSYRFTEGWSATDGADKRILFNVEFNNAFKKRESVSGTDPLWVRIESDPIIKQEKADGSYASDYNSVRQVTLNFNVNNTTVEGDHYKDRPYVIFYTGPENIDYKTDKNGVLIRHSQPVVLNLNQDTNAIIYMPNSPVIINGNDHALHGFVIAKCFLESVTSEDMTRDGSFVRYDGFNTPETFEAGYLEGTDGYGNTIYVKQDNLFDMSELETIYPNTSTTNESTYTITEEEDGNLTVTGKIEATHRLLLEYTKADSEAYEVIENGKHNENKTFAAYVNAIYEDKFKTYTGLNDSQIVAVKFPNKNYNETTATYYVENSTDVIKDSSPNDDYVEVLINGETKYIDKANLPYVKVRVNEHCFYVCVYDLKLMSSGGKGTRMIDNSYSDEQINDSYGTVKNKGIKTSTNEYKNLKDSATFSDADVYLNPDTTYSAYGDSWAIDRTWWDNKHYEKWKKDKLEFANANGSKYFMLKSEIVNDPQVVAKYRKVVVGVDDDGKEIVKYVKEGDKLYYTKIDNNKVVENGVEKVANYIIVDENGNILTKPVTSPDIFNITSPDKPGTMKSKNEDLENKAKTIGNQTLYDYWNTYTRDPKDPKEIPGDRGEINDDGQYVGKSEYRKDEDYRIPAFERVYNMSTFKLNTNSCYSYFDIEELWRVNYLYLNVDEINHTVNREASDNWKVDDMFFVKERALWID